MAPSPIQTRLELAIYSLGERTTLALSHVPYAATLAALRVSEVANRLQVLVLGATARASTAVREFDLRAELGERLDAWIGEQRYRETLRGELRFRGRAGVTIVPPAEPPSTVDGPRNEYERAYPTATRAYGHPPPGLAVVGDLYDGVELTRLEGEWRRVRKGSG